MHPLKTRNKYVISLLSELCDADLLERSDSRHLSSFVGHLSEFHFFGRRTALSGENLRKQHLLGNNNDVVPQENIYGPRIFSLEAQMDSVSRSSFTQAVILLKGERLVPRVSWSSLEAETIFYKHYHCSQCCNYRYQIF